MKMKKYQQYIAIQSKNDKITKDTECQVFCTCENFLYKYSVILFRNKALYGNRPIVNKLPKIPLISGCKHLAVACNELVTKYAKI